MVEEDKIWLPDMMAGIRERSPPETELDDISAELFGLLVNSTEGEDLQAVKAVEDGPGFEAWWRLVHRRPPSSMARAVSLVGLVVGPQKVSDLCKAEGDVRKWEDHQGTFAKGCKHS